MFNYLTTKHDIGEITYALVRITTFGKEWFDGLFFFFSFFKKNAFLNDLTDETKSLLHYFSPRCYLRNTHFGIAQLEAFYLDALKALGKRAIC